MTTKMLLWYVGQVHKASSQSASYYYYGYSTVHGALHLFQESKKAAHNLDQESEGSHSGVRVTVSFSTKPRQLSNLRRYENVQWNENDF